MKENDGKLEKGGHRNLKHEGTQLTTADFEDGGRGQELRNECCAL